MKADCVVVDTNIAFKTLVAARDVVRASFETKTYQPQDADAWAAAVPRFDQLLAATTPAPAK